ncbi:hypothetical protein RF11_09798 [Thelohanellus kitauei]|uniref:Uncharacterized protein n=1 Tax=Thelohanellus kitauei TaxID=669202 RepID=A0A0C2NA25_THEKT|nr:hypothetical protein RF11_09798 [Thelohanellus kitauei]
MKSLPPMMKSSKLKVMCLAMALNRSQNVRLTNYMEQTIVITESPMMGPNKRMTMVIMILLGRNIVTTMKVKKLKKKMMIDFDDDEINVEKPCEDEFHSTGDEIQEICDPKIEGVSTKPRTLSSLIPITRMEG